VGSLVAIAAVSLVAVGIFAGRAGADGELLVATVGTNDGFDIALNH
jgi:hypothetical protein